MFSFLDALLHESCLHKLRWKDASQPGTFTSSLARLDMIRRTIEASRTYLNILIETPVESLYQLSLLPWGSCFYAIILVCKVVFMEDNERLGNSNFDVIPQEVDNLIPQNIDSQDPHNLNTGQLDPNKGPWDPLSVSREYNIRDLFSRLMEKFRFTLQVDCPPWSLSREKRDSLHAIACIIHTLLHGYTNRIQRFASSANTSASISAHYTSQEYTGASSTAAAFSNRTTTMSNRSYPSPQNNPTQSFRAGLIPFLGSMNFDSLNFDGITLPASPAMQSNEFDDLIWDTIMNDFTVNSL